jgi:hypothetical protein
VGDDLPSLTVKSVPMPTPGQRTSGAEPGSGWVLAPPEDVLRRVRQLFPGGERLNILPYKTKVEIPFVEILDKKRGSPYCEPYVDTRDCRENYVTNVLADWLARGTNGSGFDVLLAVHHFHVQPNDVLDPGWSQLNPLRQGRPPPRLIAGDPREDDGTSRLPLKGVTHEYGHTMGAPHADTALVPGRNCGGSANNQPAEGWPDDFVGRTQSAAFDPDTLRLRMDRFDNEMYDFMSYCSKESDSWISAFNWNRAFNAMREFGVGPILARRRLAAGSRAGQAFVSGVVGSLGAKIVRVVPADPQNNPPDPDPSSPLKVRALDAGGRELGVVGAAVVQLTEGAEGGSFVVGIPNGAAAVELVANGQVLDRKTRSKPPTVRVRSPRTGSLVGGGARSRLTVRWTATDPDRDPLDVTIEYAANGRSGWRSIFSGASRGSATLPGRFLEHATGARIRVRVNDGFNESVARSGPFRAEGAPPSARIILPATSKLPAPGRTQLQGSGLDDRGRALRGASLTWFAGKRRLGRGERLRARLSAGRVTLRLVARDRFGRVTTAVRRLNVAPVQIQLSTLAGPERVSPKAKTMKITVATSTPATLRVGARRFAVRTRSRQLAIPLPAKPKTGILKVTLSVTAKGPRQRVLRHRFLVFRG